MSDNKTNSNLPDYVTDNRGFQFKTAKPIGGPGHTGSFTISEEEAAKVRAMAMANSNGEMSPEMKAAMEMVDNDDYEQKIPKDVHNHICYDEAKKNNEKYKKEATAFTDSVVHDNATKDILDEAEATTNLSTFNFGDIEEYLNKLDELSFLEAVSFRKKIDEEIARWKSCKSMLKAIGDLRLEDNVNRELMKINALEDYKFEKTVDEFESNYDENLEKLEKIANKLGSIVNKNKNRMNSTSFLTNEMIHLMEGKRSKLSPDMLNYTYTKNKMDNVIDAFSNRLDLTYLENKLQTFLRSNKNDIKRYFRTEGPMLRGQRRTKVINDLIRFFSVDIVKDLRDMLMTIFKDNVEVTYLFMRFLAKISNNEKRSGRDTWVKVFVLNLSDINNQIFDIEGDSEISYMKKVKNTFYPILDNYIKENKLSLNADNTNFGLPITIYELDDIDTDKTSSEEIPTVEAELVESNDMINDSFNISEKDIIDAIEVEPIN